MNTDHRQNEFNFGEHTVENTPHVIIDRNINQIFKKGIAYFQDLVLKQKPIATRAGDCIRHHGPFITQYNNPCERVLFCPIRDANPFFHLMESLWMLAGREDVGFLVDFNSNMGDFSDDGEVYHGAYGYRWRKTFGIDQLDLLVEELTEKPNSRQAMLQIWSSKHDLHKTSLDIPCNDMVQFEIDKGQLNMTVFNRSNDMIWGAYGANVVQFSMLLEYLAGRIGVPVGQYWQISCNFHVYTDIFEKYNNLEQIQIPDEYASRQIKPYNLVDNGDVFDAELDEWFSNPGNKVPGRFHNYENKFFPDVAIPIYRAWFERKNGDVECALKELSKCKAEDWSLACQQWIERRVK